MIRAIIWLACIYLALICFSGCADTKRTDVGEDATTTGRKIQSGSNPQINAPTYYAAAMLFERKGNFSEAIKRYQQAIDLDPMYLAAYNRMSICQNRLGCYEEAEKLLRMALSLSPETAYLHNNLAFNYMLRRQYKDAEAELRNALTIDPDFKRAKMNLGIVLAKQGLYDQALAYLLQACPPYQAHYNLALLYQAARRYDRAEQSYLRALQLRRDFLPAQQALEHLRAARKPAKTIEVSQFTPR